LESASIPLPFLSVRTLDKWTYKKRQKTPKNAENAENIISINPPENKVVHASISESMVIQCFQAMMEAHATRDEAHMAAQDAQTVATAEQTRLLFEAHETRYEAQTAAQEAHAAAAAEQTRLLIEAISLSGPRSITNNTTNNNQFNLNVFLNEDCKDAFTLKEVIESIVCTVSDLDRMDTDGYAATITRKILESMQHMSITERPIHCTDAKRNAVCVKNDTGWERNEKAMKLLVNSVYFVGRKLGCMIEDWKLAYPDHYHGTVSRRDQFHRMVTDAMSVADLDVEARIASKVCKGVILDRKAAMDR